MAEDFCIVIPTIGRESLHHLLSALSVESVDVIVVDDRPDPGPALDVDVPVLTSGGRGPAAARNAGWRATRATWVVFLDDDVLPEPDWRGALEADLAAADDLGAAGSQGLLTVPQPSGRRPTDDERRTLGLADARWITADMAYRRSVLVETGGFDERFPRAYREDSDLALRVVAAGHRIVRGQRRSTHPVAAPMGRAGWTAAVRAQIGNRDNALMRRKHGRQWRTLCGEGPGRLPAHTATTGAVAAAAACASVGRRRGATIAFAAWLALVAEFTARRFRRGPHTATELLRMTFSSILIPPVAVAHRLAGEWAFRNARREPPLAVLLDRDDTLIADGPYLNDPAGVRPLPGARRALQRLRERGLLLAVVTNQSGVATGVISPQQLDAVNCRVDAVLGPFDSWQVCVHGPDDGCRCRKPQPGMVLAAAEELGVTADRCVLIGDTGGDVEAALSARARAVLVPTRRTLRAEVLDAGRRAAVAPDLEQAVELVLRECR